MMKYIFRMVDAMLWEQDGELSKLSMIEAILVDTSYQNGRMYA